MHAIASSVSKCTGGHSHSTVNGGHGRCDFDFAAFYEDLKREGFVIYPGKVSEVDTFRIGTIGEVYPDDVDRLADAVVAHRKW